MRFRLPLGRVAFAVAVAATLLACQSTPTPAPSSPGPPASAGAGGSAFPSRFSVEVADAPFLRPSDGPDGSLWVTPAAGTRDRDGNLVLVIVWFDDGSSAPRITIATSPDGTAWNVGKSPILGDLDIGHPAPGPIPTAILQLDDGSWQLYGWAAEDASGSALWSWRTSAPSLDGPWKLDAEEILGPGPAGEWDSQVAAAGSVLRTDDGFAMWYEGEPPGSTNRGDIGLATSADGLTWSKADNPATAGRPFAMSDPVIPTWTCGEATSVAVEQPQIEHDGDGYVALFGGFGPADDQMGVFGAVSGDGRGWGCGTRAPLLTGDALGDGDGIHTIATIPLGDGRLGLIAESLAADHSELWWADVTVLAE